MRPSPRALEALRQFVMLRPGETNMDVAPPGRRWHALGRFDRGGARLIDQVHPAEIRHLVVDNEQLAMIAAVQNAQRREASKCLAQRMEGMDLNSGLFHVAKETGRGAQAADGIVEDADVEPTMGPLLQRFRNGPTCRVVVEDVAF